MSSDRPDDLLATVAEPVDDSPPLRFEEIGDEAVVTVGGTEELLRCDPSAVVEATR
ncbi:hypothetical protein EGH21_05385 [Halomicroarcula sp. F13]|uniref:Halobacterial output domain-containing protein n=1 Tax=Haloarcula rubra TaxID=2487747 RepID=A0AAW4PPJ2_9EURY|nr:hypothetical protein [Halomicroarcula rubra]MBX0322460.1 hypothetical protein [Halomicroarcula rubra]